MANEKTQMFQSIDPLLSSAVGPMTDGINRIAQQIAPPVEVYADSFKYNVFGKETMRKQPKTKRPRGGTYERVDFGKATKPGSIEEKGLTVVLDQKDRKAAVAAGPSAIFDIRQQAAAVAKAQVLNGKESEAAVTLQDVTQYGANNSSNVSIFRNTGVRKALASHKIKVRQNCGMRPNALYLAEDVYNDLIDLNELKSQFQYITSDTPDETFVAKYLQVQYVFIGAAGFLDDRDTPTEAWTNTAILFYHNPTAGLLGPTFAKTFFRKFENGQPAYVFSSMDEALNEKIGYAEEYSDSGVHIVYPDAAWFFHT